MKKVPASVTVEEAVAYMVNMDYIPTDFTLLEMLEAFSKEAEAEYENAFIDQLPVDQIKALKTRADSCNSRYNLAFLLLESLQYEIGHPENSLIVLAEESSSKRRLTFESLSDWAADKYGIGISARPVDKKLENIRWEDITIKIKENHKIGYAIKKGKKFTYKYLKEVGLMGKDKHGPNERYEILMRLSLGKTFPPGNKAENKYRKAIYDLGLVLKKLIPLQDGPFHRFNPDEGWKPRFKLTSYLAEDPEYLEKHNFNKTYDDTRKYK
jgi:hypothetical protein